MIKDEYLKFDDKDPDLMIGIEEIFGTSKDPDQWMSSIVPLPKWVAFKNDGYGAFPTVAELESINGDISRFFVLSGTGIVFYLLDYTSSKTCKGVAYLDLVGGEQRIQTLGEDLSCVIRL